MQASVGSQAWSRARDGMHAQVSEMTKNTQAAMADAQAKAKAADLQAAEYQRVRDLQIPSSM